jgi:broad specificity phosphatase PhoE
MPTLYVVRHAEPEIRGVLLGHTDPGLSEAGRAQAALLRLPEAMLYVSPLRRARETAPGARVVHDLREISYGDWDGLSWSEIEKRWPGAAAAKLEDWAGVTPPNGEEWSAFENRVATALAVVLAGPSPAVIVAHLGVNAVIASRLAGADPFCFQQQYCEINEYPI